MCTLSICLDFEKNSALVTMNRDEARDREAEMQPHFHWGGNIYGPQDKTAGGTWIAMNENGYYAALLNAYGEVSYHPKNSKTRGEIIPLILAHEKPIKFFKQMDLSPYSGFKIIVGQQTSQPQLFEWNGKNLNQGDFHSTVDGQLFFHTSSSVNQDKIIDIRAARFNHWANCGQTMNGNGIPEFHMDTQPDSSSATLMSRVQSVTKSITSIHMNRESSAMNYFPIKSNKAHLTN